MVAHCSPPVDQFVSYCAKMRQVYGKDVPLMTRERWDAACKTTRHIRPLTECEFDTGQFSEEMGDGPIY